MDTLLKAALAKKAGLKRALEAQCEGDWTRVVVEPSGVVVYNNTAQADRARARLGQLPAAEPAPATKPAALRPAPTLRLPARSTDRPHRPEPTPRPPLRLAPAPVVRREHRPLKAVPTPPSLPTPPQPEPAPAISVVDGKTIVEGRVIDLRDVRPAQTIEPGVSVEYANRTPQLTTYWVAGTEDAEFDWNAIENLEPIAWKFWQTFNTGIPDPVGYRADVLALEGFDAHSAEAAMRNPDRVEIRPETYTKKYPVLGFIRGDVKVIVGFRKPIEPMVIAAYWTSLLANDWHRTDGAGGGGARKQGGLPGTPKALVRALKDRGAQVPWDEFSSARTAPVTYKGQELGSVTLVAVRKVDVQNSWQRMARKMEAIDQREAVLARA